MWINIISTIIAGASLTFDIIIHRKQSKIQKSIQAVIDDKQLHQQFIDCTNKIAQIKMKSSSTLQYSNDDFKDIHNILDMLLRFESWSQKEKNELESHKKLFYNYILKNSGRKKFSLEQHPEISLQLDEIINLMKKRGNLL